MADFARGICVGPERDHDGQPTTLHVTYAAGHHVSEAEADWLRDLLTFVARTHSQIDVNRDILNRLAKDDS